MAHSLLTRATPALVSFVLMVSTALQLPVHAQNRMGTPQPGRFIETPRRTQQQMRDAEEAIDEKRYSDAVVALGELLAADTQAARDVDLEGQDFLLDIDDARRKGVPAVQSLFRTAREKIGDLPAAALDTYELRYGPLARRKLNEAAETRDWNSVREVRRRYFHTEAGYEASWLLAQQEFYGGHPLSASVLLDDVIKMDRAVNHLGAGVLLLHASACQLAARLVPGPDLARIKSVTVNGGTIPTDSTDGFAEWIAQRSGEIQTYSDPEPSEFAMLGALPDRNGNSAGQLPLANVRWELDTTASPRQERALRSKAGDLSAAGKLPPPCWIPLRVGGQLLMRTTERLVGVDYRTGKRVWTYPWQSPYEAFDEDESSLDSVSKDYRTSELLDQRVWNDMPYGQVTSDGQRVFMLDNLRRVEPARFGPVFNNVRGIRPSDTTTNTLVALDLATEGKLLWRLGAGAENGTEFDNAFFLGPPLPLDGRLYVIAEISGDIKLLCLDPTNGSKIWSQHLVAVESGGIDRDPTRRVAGAAPTYHEGIMICPTGAGAILAIDLGDRMLRWGINFDRNLERTTSFAARARGLKTSQQNLMQRWYSGTAIAAESAVLVTPTESDRLYGFDLLTGESLFGPKTRTQMRFLAGARDGRFFSVGDNRMQAYDLQTGEPVWTSPRNALAAGQRVSGIGVFGDGEYLLPTTTGEIVQVSLQDGTILGRRQTNYQLGNLVAAGGELISQGPTKLAVAFGEASLEPLVDRMLAANPDDIEALVRKSELLIQRGQRREALQLLQRAREMDSENDVVRMLSVSAMIGELRLNPTLDPKVIKELDQLIYNPSQRAEFYSLRANALISQGRYADAAKQLVDLSSIVGTGDSAELALDDDLPSDPTQKITLDSWLAGQTKEIVALASESEREEIHDVIRGALQSRVDGSTSLLAQTMRHFGKLPGVEMIRNELAGRYRTDKDGLRLERLALGDAVLSAEGTSELSTERLIGLAEAQVLGRFGVDAQATLDEIANRTDVDRLGDSVEQDLLEMRSKADAQIRRIEWRGQVEVSWEKPQTRFRPMARSPRINPIGIRSGRHFDNWTLFGDRSADVALRDPDGQTYKTTFEGFNRVSMVSGGFDKQSHISGGFMVVLAPGGLVGFDLYHLRDGEAELWKHNFRNQAGFDAKPRSTTTPFDDSVVRYLVTSGAASKVVPELRVGPIYGDSLIFSRAGLLSSLDLFSGKTRWSNSAAPKSGAIVGDENRIAVVSADTQQVAFFDAIDGEAIGQQPWNHGKLWDSFGTNVLAYKQSGPDEPFELRLVNPLTGDVLLQHEMLGRNRNPANDVPCGYAHVVAKRFLAAMTRDGEAIVWDLRDGREVSRINLPEVPNMRGLEAMYLRGQILLMPVRYIESNAARQRQGPIRNARSGTMHREVHAVHAINLDDGSLNWERVFEESWGCTVTQPANTPILLFTRSLSVHRQTTRGRDQTLDILAIDVRDGKTLHEKLDQPIARNINQFDSELKVQPGLSRVVASVGNERIVYTFVESPPGESEAQPD